MALDSVTTSGAALAALLASLASSPDDVDGFILGRRAGQIKRCKWELQR